MCVWEMEIKLGSGGREGGREEEEGKKREKEEKEREKGK